MGVVFRIVFDLRKVTLVRAVCWRGCLGALGVFHSEGVWLGWVGIWHMVDGSGSVRFGAFCALGALCLWVLGCWDEPESLILAQSERWRHA